MKPTRHQTVKMLVNGKSVDVDQEISDLIRVMNAIPGINTKSCCQNNLGQGFVQFEDDRGAERHRSSATFIHEITLVLEPVIQEQARLERLYLLEHGSRHGTRSLAFDFLIVVGENYIMRWRSDQYRFILNAALQVSKRWPLSPPMFA